MEVNKEGTNVEFELTFFNKKNSVDGCDPNLSVQPIPTRNNKMSLSQIVGAPDLRPL
jgi:hypothetical protein